MPVVDRAALEDSPLADLHAIASELGIDGFRRLRKAQLVDAILEHQGGEGAAAVAAPAPESAPDPAPAASEDDEEEEKPRRSRRSRSRKEPKESREPKEDRPEPAAEPAAREDRVVEGVVELLGNGSGFVRVEPPEPSDDDVYISAAQVRRCELVSGDRV